MYELVDYRDMTSDRVRVEAHAAAIRAVVRPGDVVLDAGAGIGILSVLAARAGARRVFAVEPNACVHFAKRVLEENGVLGLVELFRGKLEDVVLPEPATVVVCDARGPLCLDSQAVPVWRAVLPRLAPGARTIPRRDVLLAEPVRSPLLSQAVHAFGPVAGVAFSSVRPALSSARQAEREDTLPLAPAQALLEIPYAVPFPPHIRGGAEFRVDAPATVHAFRVGFEADLAPGISYRSFGPGSAGAYGVHVLPTLHPIDAVPATRLGLRVSYDLVGDTATLRWAVDVDGREGPWQGPFLHAPESLDVLLSGRPEHVPAPDAGDDLEALVLGAFSKGRRVGDAISEAQAAFRGRLAPETVEARVVELSRRRQERVVRRLGGGS